MATITVANYAALLAITTAEDGQAGITQDTNDVYIWDGAGWIKFIENGFTLVKDTAAIAVLNSILARQALVDDIPVADYAALTAYVTTGLTIGRIAVVQYTGSRYIWSGLAWVKFTHKGAMIVSEEIITVADYATLQAYVTTGLRVGQKFILATTGDEYTWNGGLLSDSDALAVMQTGVGGAKKTNDPLILETLQSILAQLAGSGATLSFANYAAMIAFTPTSSLFVKQECVLQDSHDLYAWDGVAWYQVGSNGVRYVDVSGLIMISGEDPTHNTMNVERQRTREIVSNLTNQPLGVSGAIGDVLDGIDIGLTAGTTNGLTLATITLKDGATTLRVFPAGIRGWQELGGILAQTGFTLTVGASDSAVAVGRFT